MEAARCTFTLLGGGGWVGLIYEVQWVLCGCPLLSKKKVDSLDALIHLSWDVRAAWMREGGRVESKRGADGPLSVFETWKGWIPAPAERLRWREPIGRSGESVCAGLFLSPDVPPCLRPSPK